MTSVDWRSVPAGGFRVPTDASLADLTADLTALLGSPDPALRCECVLPVLTTWVARGVYDDLLIGLGDGIAMGLSLDRAVGAPDPADLSVLRRSSSAAVLGQVIERDNRAGLVPGTKVLEWGDRLATWLLAERDLRTHVAGSGWVQAVAVGADAVGHLVASAHLGEPELAAVLEVIGERVLGPATRPWGGSEADRLARATVRLLHRGTITLEQAEDWTARIGVHALAHPPGSGTPDPVAANADAFLRSLYLVLALAPEPPTIRADLVLTLVGFLRELHPDLIG